MRKVFGVNVRPPDTKHHITALNWEPTAHDATGAIPNLLNWRHLSERVGLVFTCLFINIFHALSPVTFPFFRNSLAPTAAAATVFPLFGQRISSSSTAPRSLELYYCIDCAVLCHGINVLLYMKDGFSLHDDTVFPRTKERRVHQNRLAQAAGCYYQSVLCFYCPSKAVFSSASCTVDYVI